MLQPSKRTRDRESNDLDQTTKKRKRGRPFKFVTDNSRSISTCQTRDGTAKVGDTYWVNLGKDHALPGLIREIRQDKNDKIQVKVKWFKQYAPQGIILGHYEWILIEKVDDVSSDSLANKASMLTWPEYQKKTPSRREENLYCRFTRLAGAERTDIGAYRCIQAEDFSESDRQLDEWRLCACNCNKPLDPDRGYTYCTKCSKTTADAHVTGLDESKFLRTRMGLLYVVDKSSNAEKQATCICRAPFRSSNFELHSFGPAEMDEARRKFLLTCDAGTRDCRMLCQELGNNSFPPILHTYPSTIFISESGSMVAGHPWSSTRGQDGVDIFPLKAAVLSQDTQTRRILTMAKLDGEKLFGEAIHDLVTDFKEEIINRHFSTTGDAWFAENDVTVAAAYPSCLTGNQKSIFITALLRACPGARIAATSEPVAAFYAMDEASNVTGRHAVLDVGATTIDCALLELREGEVKVFHDFGLDFGADRPDYECAKDLMKKTNGQRLLDCLEVVRPYGDAIKGGKRWSSVLFGVDIKEKYRNELIRFYVDLESQLKKRLPGKHWLRSIESVLLCGGGARSPRVRKIIQDCFPRKTIRVYDEFARSSHVLRGCQVKLDFKHAKHYSPVTICLECDKGQMTGTDLIVIALADQALDGTKVLDTQIKPGKLIVMDTQLGDTDARLKLKGRFGVTECAVNSNGLLVAVSSASQEDLFYDIGEIHIPQNAWVRRGTTRPPKNALTVLDLSLDVTAGVIICHGALIKRPRNEDLINKIETFTDLSSLDEYETLATTQVATSLNLNESNDSRHARVS